MLPATLCAGGLYNPIPLAEVARLLNAPGVAILDLNVPEVWQKHHLPGAVHVTSPDLEKFLPPERNALLVFYCAGPMCDAAETAAELAVRMGYRRVYVMKDGIFAWIKAGYPTESAPPAKSSVGGQPRRGSP